MEMETETELSIYVNIRNFGLSKRIRLFVHVIFSICLYVYFLELWHFLYLATEWNCYRNRNRNLGATQEAPVEASTAAMEYIAALEER